MTEPNMKDVVMMQRIMVVGIAILLLIMAVIVVKFTWPWSWLTWDNVLGGGLVLFIVIVVGFPFYVACKKGIIRSRF